MSRWLEMKRYRSAGAADDPQIDVIHDAHLELIRGVDGAHHAAHLLYVAVRKDVTRQCVKGFTVGNALHGSGDLVRNEGTQVLKLIRSIHSLGAIAFVDKLHRLAADVRVIDAAHLLGR